MWGMVGEVLRDEVHGRMEKVSLQLIQENLRKKLKSCFCLNNSTFSLIEALV